MTKTKLSGSVDMLHCYMDKQKQVNGERAIRQRKKYEKHWLNMRNRKISQFLKDAINNYKVSKHVNKRQKVSDQIQRGFDIVEKWKE